MGHFSTVDWFGRSWGSLKVQNGHTKVNIKLIQDFDVENTTIKLQLDKAIYEEL